MPERINLKIRRCRGCPLYKTRKNAVVGQGNTKAKIMFIGEAPGATEDKTGVPFCGSAGKILDELLKSVKIRREDVYITNILKCRPPKNRDPLVEESEKCAVFLEKQIEIIKPRIICPLGRHAMNFILNEFNIEAEQISRAHGKRIRKGKMVIIPLYHPAVAVYNKNMKSILLEDFKKIIQ